MIQRNNGPNEATFSVGLNVILTGSKKMTPVEQEQLITVPKVRILIVDANNPKNVLLDETESAKEFSTGSVGYGLHKRGLKFEKGKN